MLTIHLSKENATTSIQLADDHRWLSPIGQNKLTATPTLQILTMNGYFATSPFFFHAYRPPSTLLSLFDCQITLVMPAPKIFPRDKEMFDHNSKNTFYKREQKDFMRSPPSF